MESLTIDNEQFYLIKGEELLGFLDDLAMKKAKDMRIQDRTHCVDKWEAMKILGCSERTFYKKVNAKGSSIRKGSSNGSYIKESIFKERDGK